MSLSHYERISRRERLLLELKAFQDHQFKDRDILSGADQMDDDALEAYVKQIREEFASR